MVLAEAVDLDVADQHHFLVVGLERGRQYLGGVDAQPGEQLGVRLRDPGRGLPQAVPVGVLADGDEDLPHRVLDPLEVDRLLDGLAAEPAVHQARRQVVQVAADRTGIVIGLRAGAGVQAGQREPSEPPESASTPSASACAFRLSFSDAVSTGGWSDGWRLPNPLYGAIGGRLTTRAAIRAMSACEMVSFSKSSSTIASSTS